MLKSIQSNLKVLILSILLGLTLIILYVFLRNSYDIKLISKVSTITFVDENTVRINDVVKINIPEKNKEDTFILPTTIFACRYYNR